MAPTKKDRQPSKGAKLSKTKAKSNSSKKSTTHHSSGQPKSKPEMRGNKKKKRIYTEKELGIPKLNMITPVGVTKPKGKKKGKVFVDDRQSMMTILAMVNADKEGEIESKMIKARQLEEIREARQKEAETRQEARRSKLEETKDSLRKKKNRSAPKDNGAAEPAEPLTTAKKSKKVTFG